MNNLENIGQRQQVANNNNNSINTELNKQTEQIQSTARVTDVYIQPEKQNLIDKINKSNKITEYGQLLSTFGVQTLQILNGIKEQEELKDMNDGINDFNNNLEQPKTEEEFYSSKGTFGRLFNNYNSYLKGFQKVRSVDDSIKYQNDATNLIYDEKSEEEIEKQLNEGYKNQLDIINNDTSLTEEQKQEKISLIKKEYYTASNKLYNKKLKTKIDKIEEKKAFEIKDIAAQGFIDASNNIKKTRKDFKSEKEYRTYLSQHSNVSSQNLIVDFTTEAFKEIQNKDVGKKTETINKLSKKYLDNINNSNLSKQEKQVFLSKFNSVKNKLTISNNEKDVLEIKNKEIQMLKDIAVLGKTPEKAIQYVNKETAKNIVDTHRTELYLQNLSVDIQKGKSEDYKLNYTTKSEQISSIYNKKKELILNDKNIDDTIKSKLIKTLDKSENSDLQKAVVVDENEKRNTYTKNLEIESNKLAEEITETLNDTTLDKETKSGDIIDFVDKLGDLSTLSTNGGVSKETIESKMLDSVSFSMIQNPMMSNEILSNIKLKEPNFYYSNMEKLLDVNNKASAKLSQTITNPRFEAVELTEDKIGKVYNGAISNFYSNNGINKTPSTKDIEDFVISNFSSLKGGNLKDTEIKKIYKGIQKQSVKNDSIASFEKLYTNDFDVVTDLDNVSKLRKAKQSSALYNSLSNEEKKLWEDSFNNKLNKREEYLFENNSVAYFEDKLKKNEEINNELVLNDIDTIVNLKNSKNYTTDQKYDTLKTLIRTALPMYKNPGLRIKTSKSTEISDELYKKVRHVGYILNKQGFSSIEDLTNNENTGSFNETIEMTLSEIDEWNKDYNSPEMKLFKSDKKINTDIKKSIIKSNTIKLYNKTDDLELLKDLYNMKVFREWKKDPNTTPSTSSDDFDTLSRTSVDSLFKLDTNINVIEQEGKLYDLKNTTLLNKDGYDNFIQSATKVIGEEVNLIKPIYSGKSKRNTDIYELFDKDGTSLGIRSKKIIDDKYKKIIEKELYDIEQIQNDYTKEQSLSYLPNEEITKIDEI